MKKKNTLIIFLWIAYFLTLSVLLSGYEGLEKSLGISFIVVIFQVIIVYTNTIVLLPYLFENKRFTLYIISVILVIIILTIIRSYFPVYFIDDNSRVNILRIRRISFVFNLTIAYALSTAYYFANEWFKNIQLKAELKFRQVETELKYLKNQINPHFLFNTLNNIYTLAYLKDDKAPEAIMKLSDMMRYILNDGNTQLIELEKEIQFIQDYLELQKLKSEENIDIVFLTSGVKGRHLIAPMLLIIFFENCFKHSNIGINPNAWIKAVLNVDDKNEMDFVISNSKKPANGVADRREHLGLENIKNRLSLQYRDKYSLMINENEDNYNVKLKLQLDG